MLDKGSAKGSLRPQWLKNIDAAIESLFLKCKPFVFLWPLELLGLVFINSIMVQAGVLIYQVAIYLKKGFWSVFSYYGLGFEINTSLLGINNLVNYVLDLPVFASTFVVGFCICMVFGLMLGLLFFVSHIFYRMISMLIFFWWDAAK